MPEETKDFAADPLTGGETVDMDRPPSRAPHADPEQIGPYRIVERIGQGGMGLVYKAEQRHPVRRIVALKVIRIGMDTEEVVARFEAERQALAMMNHPNVAKVYEAGMTDAGRPYFAMEFVPGVPLTKYCDDSKLTTRQRLELFILVCHAVQHAHQKGIIHRDLKPTNILVTLFDGKPVPKVIDFGIAKATNQQLTQKTLFTQTGALIGTPEYMSPEQAMTSGLDVDTRTDVYSLGVILFELLTGTVPFDAKALREAGLEGMARIIRETEPPKPSTRLSTVMQEAGVPHPDGTGKAPAKLRLDPRTLQREIRGDLDWITLKAMEKDRTRRYETANALAMDLRRHLDDEPVLARPPSATYRIGKFVRKHSVGVAAAAAVATALVAGLGAAVWGWSQAVTQSQAALRAKTDADQQRLIAEHQRTAAQQAKAVAEKASQGAREANAFLRDLFMSFGNAPGARERLTSAVARLDSGWLEDQPDTHIACRIALGYFFAYQMEDPGQGERQLNLALEMIKQPDGSYPPAAAAPIRMALGEISAGRRAEVQKAEQYLRQALADYRGLPQSQATIARVLIMLSELRDMQEDPAGARALRLESLSAVVLVTSNAIAARPSDGGPYSSRALAQVRMGRFEEALADVVKATALEPSDHWAWYRRSCLHLYLKDDAGYRAAAGEMFKLFAGSNRREIAERAAKVCLLSPNTAGEIGALTAIADHTVAPGANAALLPWFHLCKGLADYRRGEYESAISSLARARSLNPADAQATLDLLTAMANHRLSRPEQAREWFERGVLKMDTQLPKAGEDDLGVNPENWLVAHIIRREAEALINNRD